MGTEHDHVRWHAGMSEAYEEHLVKTVFEPFTGDLSRRVAVIAPADVLELAAGTGALTRALVAVLPDAHVVATDLNPAMVDVGRRRAPQAAWRQADALDLPFDDASFDIVVCQFGAMFFPDRPAGFASIRRVLRPHGRCLFNVWATLDTHDFETALVAAVEEVVGAGAGSFFAATPHGYNDEAQIRADIAAGGLEMTVFDTVTVEGHAPSAADLARGYCTGTPLRAELEAKTADFDAAVEAVAAAFEARMGAGPVSGRMAAHVVEAVPA